MRSEGYGTVCLSVCLSVTLSFGTRLCGSHSAIPAAALLQGHKYKRGIFPETTAFQRYGVETSKKPRVKQSHMRPCHLATVARMRHVKRLRMSTPAS